MLFVCGLQKCNPQSGGGGVCDANSTGYKNVTRKVRGGVGVCDANSTGYKNVTRIVGGGYVEREGGGRIKRISAEGSKPLGRY